MKLSEKIQEALREQQEINLSDPAVQKRLAAQWGYVPAEAQPAQSIKDAIIDDLQSQFDSDGITEHDSGDALIRLSDAIAAVEDNFAQPAPSVPTALLVAVADLCAQMEIVRRVGFVDTPNDKDSCAAFCVAEGTWLELMSCVEALTVALAAAPEAKP